MASESQSTGFAVDAKRWHVVGALIAHVKELASRVEIEAPRIIAAGPFLRDEPQLAVFTNRENRDTIMQAVARVNEPAISRNQNLRAKIAARKPGRQAGDGLARCQPPKRCIVIEQDDVRAFLLERVQPAIIRVKQEMPRAITRRQRDRRRIVRA